MPSLLALALALAARLSLLTLPLSTLAAPFNSARTVTPPTGPKVIIDNDWCITCFVTYLVPLDYGWDIIGILSDTSNSWSLQGALHAQASLEIGGLDSCIPVYSGADFPLLQTAHTFQTWELLHGVLPWEGVFAKENATLEALGNDPTSGDPKRVVEEAFEKPGYGYPNGSLATDTTAAGFLVEQVRKYPGEVVIYSGGALTNIALAVRMDPDFAKNTAGLYIMGGYIDRMIEQTSGDVLQADLVSDINLIIDPESAKIALTADFPNITIVGNVANVLTPDTAYLEDVFEVENPFSQLMLSYAPTFLPFWDETAAAIMVDPSIVLEEIEFYADVDTSFNSPYYGYIRPYQAALMPPGLRTVRYITKVNETALSDIIKHSIQYPKTCADLGK
ncbi:Inosine/uridine-preferring nucleoside hydrolase domain-containing protein [Lasiosphaeris hirsuta]|uniref:Inosine/uridine-preferring nucleoside hydrolase domain-containing protein n=1 Tax=Lasiosphaeris hirsuta TaxID=260670 RepID=A0AA40A3B6_9PEZI|nr:Inosine/uridine-preferring nucleoside hydrolase domain-containing protein [Lasiosphaeris hirsuta]